MKNLSNITNVLWAMALVLAGSTATAGTYNLPDVTFRKLDEGRKVMVEVRNLKGDAEIRLTDEQGHNLLEKQVVTGTPYAGKVFNLENLPAGDYSFIVATAHKETLQPVRLTVEGIDILEDKRQVYLVPTIKVGEDYVDVNWLNGRISNLTVEIMTPQGATVFADQLNNILKVERRYNLSKLERGDYTMVVSTPYKSYYQALQVK